MLLQFPSIVAFSILSFTSHVHSLASSHERFHRHHSPQHIQHARAVSQTDSKTVQVPEGLLNLLQTENVAFQQWMGSWLDSENQTDRASSVALLRQEIQAYQGWMGAWLAAATSTNAPTSIPLPPSIPVTVPLASASSSRVLSTTRHTSAPTTASSQEASSRPSATSLPVAGKASQTSQPSAKLTSRTLGSTSPKLSSTSRPLSSSSSKLSTTSQPLSSSSTSRAPSSSTSRVSSSSTSRAPSNSASRVSSTSASRAPSTSTSQAPRSSTSRALSSSTQKLSSTSPTPTSIKQSQTSFITSISQRSTKTSSVLVPPVQTITSIEAPVVVSSILSSRVAAAPSGGSGSSGSFDAKSSKNLAVYYGQTEATGKTKLSQMCQDKNVDIVILAFLTEFFGPGGYPKLNFGAACGGQTSQMKAAGADGLLSCPDLASQIAQCQGLGKKVFLSLGGAIAISAFSSDSQAAGFATKLWDLFGAGTGEDAGLRPFGALRLDGFDVDNEDHSTFGYNAFVSALRETMNTDTSKTYYIAAAPQCPRPDASIPLEAMQAMDFVFVQFYNNAMANCNIGQPGFMESLKAWSSDLSAKGAGPKLYVGAPGCPKCAGTGYLDPASMASAVADVKNAGIPNFGGVMLWDGPEALANVNGGKDYLTAAKAALG